MKYSLYAFVLLLIAGMIPAQEAPSPMSLGAVRAIGNEAAAKGPTVSFEATVTYYRGYERMLFVQDGDEAIYVVAADHLTLQPGDRVRVRGTLQPSFHPVIVNSEVALLHHGALFPPLHLGYEQMVDDRYDCRLVAVHGVVRSADILVSTHQKSGTLQLSVDGRSIEVLVDSSDSKAIHDLLGAEVEVTGTVSGRFDGKYQRTGIVLRASSLTAIKVLKRAQASPWSLPVSPMDQLLTGYRAIDSSQRYHVRGAITYYQPGISAVLQSGGKSLWIETQTVAPLRIGDIADATGFPEVRSDFLALRQSEIQDTGVAAPVKPVSSNWQELASSIHIFDLVSIEGQVVAMVRTGSQDEYVLSSGGRLFTAIYRHPAPIGEVSTPLPPMKEIPPGSRIRVTGVCVPENSNPFAYNRAFNILLRSFDDIAVVAGPPWLNMRTMQLIAVVLLAIAILAALSSLVLERRLRRQTAALAASVEREADLEHRRATILEEINGARPQEEILKKILDLVAYKLGGAPCWCVIGGVAPIGNAPALPASKRILGSEIVGKNGIPLGSLHAALESGSAPRPEEAEALAMGSALAALAIETGRIYSDLLHRSNFDLLTDIHNRFSLDRYIDECIEQAATQPFYFALIYIDLDDFKGINDLYGHQVGDLYLQEVARRMNRLLRPQDMLARLGGDEFALLIPGVRSRSEAKEIIARLDACFDHPLLIEGRNLYAAFSAGVALFPEDGQTRDAIFHASDHAMYESKHRKQRRKLQREERRNHVATR
jgi:diguanylate cyclase (GGDEF)-like protein